MHFSTKPMTLALGIPSYTKGHYDNRLDSSLLITGLIDEVFDLGGNYKVQSQCHNYQPMVI